jgi:hypothetical protein
MSGRRPFNQKYEWWANKLYGAGNREPKGRRGKGRIESPADWIGRDCQSFGWIAFAIRSPIGHRCPWEMVERTLSARLNPRISFGRGDT